MSPTLSLVNAEVGALTSNEMRVGSSEEAAEDVHAVAPVETGEARNGRRTFAFCQRGKSVFEIGADAEP